MVVFNELRITPNGERFIIDVSIKSDNYYENVYLDSIQIDNQDSFTETGPSSNLVYEKTIEGDQKSYRVELSKLDVSVPLKDNLFFVYIKAKGTPAPDTPCGEDNIYTIGVTFNKCPIHNNMMQSIRETIQDCSVPKNFIDSFLRFKAFVLSINTEHYTEAIKYYNRFYKNMPVATTKGCGCHG